MTDVRSVSVRLSAKTSEYIAGMGAAERSTDSLGRSLSRVEARGAAASKTLAGIQKAAVFGAGAAVAGFVVAGKAAADYGEKMALVQTLSHANEQQMKQLDTAAQNLGQRIGYTANQVADGEAEMIKAGVSLRDILKGGLKGALDLAAAGQTDVATATTIAASAMTEFRLRGKDIPHLADLLAAGADKALGSVEDLGYGLEQAGTTAHQMGIGVNEAVGTLAAFAQAGLIGERGGTTFKQMLLQLASPTKNAQALMDMYGVSLYNANGQIKTMPELADNLQRSFERLTPAQRNAALGTIFGSRAIQGANILMAEGSKGIAEWIRKVDDQGFAAQQASGKLNSLKGDLAKFKGEVQDDLINLGTGSQSPLRHLVQGATRELRTLRKNGDLKRWGNEVSDVFVTIGRDGLPIAKQVGHAIGTIGHGIGVVAHGFEKLPDGIQQAIVTGGVVAYGAHKLGIDSLVKGAYGTATRRGAAGAVGALASRGGVVPVYVTNWGGKSMPGGEGPRGVPMPRGSVPKTPTNLGIPEHFWDLTKNGARDLISSSVGKVSGEGLLKGALRGVLGAPAWITAGDAGNEVLQPKMLGPNAFSSMLAAAGAKKAADATKEWAKAQTGLNELLQAPALPKYAARLSSLPKKVRTEIATPGAVTSLSDVAELAKRYHLTPKQVRTVIELANSGKVKAEATTIGRLYGLTPKQVRTLISQAGMDSSQSAIRRLASLYHLTPKQVRTIVHADTAQAQAAVSRIKAMLGGIPRSISTSYYVNQVNSISKRYVPGHVPGSADGSTVPKTGLPYADRHLYALADGEEVTSNRRGQADRYRPVLKAINADMPRHHIRDMLAGGGTAGWPGGVEWPHGWGGVPAGSAAHSASALTAEIRDLNAAIKANTHELNQTGKDRPSKAERKRLEAEQKELRKHLARFNEVQAAVKGLNLVSTLPAAEDLHPILTAVRGELSTFQHALHKAGVDWTKQMGHLADRAKSAALALDKHHAALDADKEELQNLQDQQASYVSSIRDQFTASNFGGGQQADPTTGQAYVSDLQAQMQQMFLNRVNADRFLTDLKKIRKDGISKAAFTQLAASGDVDLLDQLAEGGRSSVKAYSTSYVQMVASAQAVSKFSGGVAYGDEVRSMKETIAKQQATITRLDGSIRSLNAELKHLHSLPAEVRQAIENRAKTAQGAQRNTPKGA